MSMIYCIDTSSLIFAKNSYPRDLFPGIWLPLEEKIKDGTLISIQPVREELGKGNAEDELQKWITDNEQIFREVTTDIGVAVKKVIQNAKEIVNHQAEKDEADPYIIALAMTVGGTVVTQEGRKIKNGQMKIPLVCDRLKVRCTDLHGMMRDLNWSLTAKK